MQKLLFICAIICVLRPAVAYSVELPIPEGVESELILQYPKAPSESFSETEALRLCHENQTRSQLKYFETICIYTRQESLDDKLSHKKQLLSLSVYGVGILKNLPWRLLYSTQALSEEGETYLGTKLANAKWNCESILNQRRSSLVDAYLYQKARCKTFRDAETENWFFKIETQNPFI